MRKQLTALTTTDAIINHIKAMAENEKKITNTNLLQTPQPNCQGLS